MRGLSHGRRVVLGASLGAVMLGIACSDDPASISVLEADGGSTLDANGPGDPTVDAGTDADSSTTGDAGKDADAGRSCTDEGWCQTPLPSADLTVRDVWADGTGVAWAVSENGKVLRYDGKTWSVVFDAPGALYAVWGSSPTDIWIGSSNGLLHGTGPASNAIDFRSVDLSVPIQSILGISPTDIWAVGYGEDVDFTFDTGRVFHYAGGTGMSSAEWAMDDVTSSSPALYSKVWGTSDDDVWIGGDGTWGEPCVRHRVSDGNGGTTWTADGTTPADTYGQFRSGFSISQSEVWLTGFGDPGSYYVGNQATGSTAFDWTKGTGAVPKSGLAQVDGWGTAPNDVWLVGVFGRLNHWDGTAWKPASIALTDVFPVVQDFYAIWGNGPNDIWVVGQDIALHKQAP